MRNLLPKEEYRLIKNRMCARVNRSKRRNKIDTLEDKLFALKEENNQLKRKLNYLQTKQSSKQTHVNDKSSSSNDSFVASDDNNSSDNDSNNGRSATKKTPEISLNDFSIAMDLKKQFKDAKALFSPSDELKISYTQPETPTLRNDKHIAANEKQSPDTCFSLAMPFDNNEETDFLFMAHSNSKLTHISTDETDDGKFLSPLKTILTEKGFGAQQTLYVKQFSAWEKTK